MDLPWVGVFAADDPQATEDAAEFSPGDMDGLLTWLVPEESPDYEAGTEDDIRTLQTWADLGSLATDFAQATSADRPEHAAFPEGRAVFFAGVSQRMVSGATAASYSPLHNGAGGTIILVLRPTNLALGTRTVLGTHTPAGAPVGFSLQTLSTGALRVNIADGVSLDAFDSAGGVLADDTTAIVCCRHSASEASVLNVRVGGVEVVDASGYVAVSPSGAAPVSALTLGSGSGGSDPWHGYVPEVLVFDRYLSDEDCSQVESYLASWSLSVSYDDLADPLVGTALYGLVYFGRSTGAAWEDRYGATVTEVGAPTHGAGATITGGDVMTTNGSDEYAHNDSVAAQFSGDDTPITILALFAGANASANMTPVGLTNSASSNGFYRITQRGGISSLFTLAHQDDAGTANDVRTGPTDTAAHFAGGSKDSAGLARRYHDLTQVAVEDWSAHGTTTVNRCTVGAESRGGSEFDFWNGEIACVFLGTRGLNQGDFMALRSAVLAEFAL